MAEIDNKLLGLGYIVFSLVTYFIPYFVARSRRHHNLTAIGLLNLFLGWTLVGWVAALVWAVLKPAHAPTGQ